MQRSTKVAAGLGAFTAAAELIYWTLVFTGLFAVTDLVPGYRQWFFMSFPAPDAWIAASGVWLAVAAIRRSPTARMAAASLGGALLFLALYALAYGVNTGLLCILTTDEIIEIAVKIYCLSAGAFLIWFSVSRERQQIARRIDEAS